LSTEQQKQSEQPDANGAKSRALIVENTSKQEPTANNEEDPGNHQHNFFGHLQDRLYTYNVRMLLRDPRVWIEIIALIVLGLYTNYTRLTLNEIRNGSGDTHALAVAARKQADASKSISDATQAQSDSAAAQAASMKALAERALSQARATNALATEAKRQADVAESQKASPWVGIDRDSFGLEGPTYDWTISGTPTIRFQARFLVKNFGSAPALHYRARMNTVAIPFTPFYVTIPEWGDRELDGGPGLRDDPRRVHACALTEPEATVENYRTSGSVILPGETRRDSVGSYIADAIAPKALGPVWTTLCITYFGPNDQLHHSGYGFMSFFTVGKTQPTILPDHPGWSFLQLNDPAILMQSNAN